MIKMIAIAAIISMLGSGLWWVISTAKENERLTANLDLAITTNAESEEAFRQLTKLKDSMEKQIISRDKALRRINAKATTLKRELKDAKKHPTITINERECMESDIPAPVLDLLRDQPENIEGDSGNEGLSEYGVLLGDYSSRVHWYDVGRPVGLHHRTQSPYRDTG